MPKIENADAHDLFTRAVAMEKLKAKADALVDLIADTSFIPAVVDGLNGAGFQPPVKAADIEVSKAQDFQFSQDVFHLAPAYADGAGGDSNSAFVAAVAGIMGCLVLLGLGAFVQQKMLERRAFAAFSEGGAEEEEPIMGKHEEHTSPSNEIISSGNVRRRSGGAV
jgi:hypothetical protein